MTESLVTHTHELARMAKLASFGLGRFSAEKRNEALNKMADELEKNQALILDANELDCKAAHSLIEQGEMSTSLLKRLKLDQGKLHNVIEGIRRLTQLEDPLDKTTLSRELDEGLQLYRKSCPLGVVLVIFESRPDALPQIVSLLVKSGNAGMIKGGSEADNSNRMLFNCIHKALISCGFPEATMTLLSSRDEVADLLKYQHLIDLIIPRGSSDLVRHIQESTHIPVLGHAEGICHVYVDEKADADMAQRIIIDSKTNYPAACNSAETILIHKSLADKFLPPLSEALADNGVEVRLDAREIENYDLPHVVPATEEDWRTEYCDLTLSIKIVDSLAEAIEHINKYGSGHTDAIVTEDEDTFNRFFQEVNSAGVYWNASTRFADGYRYGFGAEVGISTSRLHPRGPVGVEGLCTYKYMLKGKGHLVADYTGHNAKKFTHKDLDSNS